MKKSIIFGVIIGLLASICLMLLGIGGNFLYTISLGFVLDNIGLSESMGWIIGFIFFPVVYGLYGAIIGAIIEMCKK